MAGEDVPRVEAKGKGRRKERKYLKEERKKGTLCLSNALS